jgi:DNA-binding MarR family transcriptional regulator
MELKSAQAERRRAQAEQWARSERVEATAFLYAIVETAERLKTARAFDGSPALRFDSPWALLRVIERRGGCPSFSDVARLLRVTRQSARALVFAAEKAGAVEVFPDPDDRRAFQVALTASGRRTLDAHRMPALTRTFTLPNGLERTATRSTTHVLHVLAERLRNYEIDMKVKRGGSLP